VGRGGEKLDAALEHFAVAVDGRRALDAGASTGGFTDCLLRRGATHVYAVDVGYGQLHPRLRQDPRVSVFERTDIRRVTPAMLGGAGGPVPPLDLVTADLSFISLTRALPVLTGELVAPGADLVLLVKPQFEAGRREVSKGRGVVRDPVVWRRALSSVASALGTDGAGIMGAVASPIPGAAGNVEFFLHARPGLPGLGPDDVEAGLDRAVAAVVGPGG
jgi:23S rRNA (cytidine1920-2'-O)/16S rRNA (cytidine1409-2'-O)-methyltransferase